MAKLIKTNGEVTTIEPSDLKNGFTIDEIHSIIGCEHFECPCYMDGGRMFYIVIDEEGKLLGKEINMKATEIALRNDAISSRDSIVGDALLCSDSELL